MFPFPTEIWMQIVEEHLLRPEWLMLSTTSSALRPIAQASLFRRITLKSFMEPANGREETRSLPQFVRSLEERPQLGAFVHSLDIECYTKREDRCQRYLLSTPGLFPHLQTLKLYGTRIDADFCAALNSSLFPRLTYLEFEHCPIAGPIPLQADPRTLSTTIAIKCPLKPGLTESWAAVAPTSMQGLILSIGSWGPRDIDYTDAVLSNLMMQSRTQALTKLVIQSIQNIPATLIPLLASAPHIRTLAIGSPNWRPAPVDLEKMASLPPDAIPFLEEFRGWAEFAQLIVPNRPVQAVYLNLDRLVPIDVLHSLRLSTASITHLIFTDLADANLGPFLQHAPTSILHLGWHCTSKERVLSSIPGISHLSSLNVVKATLLRIATNREDPTDEKEIIQKLSDACPFIQEFNFGHEKWLARGKGDWERYFSI